VSSYRVIVGLRTDRPATEYYVGFDAGNESKNNVDSVRAMMEGHLGELRRQSAALEAILCSHDPESAERLLEDGLRLQVTEVVLRPELDERALLPILSASFTTQPRLS
jgi:hypothetical protein